MISTASNPGVSTLNGTPNRTLNGILNGTFNGTPIVLVETKSKLEFKFDHVTFSRDFEGGRLSDCKKLDEHQYLLTVKPEKKPVNSSPWYAFELTAQEPTKIDICMEFD